MQKKITKTAQTVEEATNLALQEIKNELNNTPFTHNIEILETPKKKLFGGFKGEAIVAVTYEYNEVDTVNVSREIDKTNQDDEATQNNKSESLSLDNPKLKIALKYIDDILLAMNLKDISYDVSFTGENVNIVLKGESIGILIGHHGETLDALQYLMALSCSRMQGDYFRITLDGGNYREKRENALKDLASKISQKVKKTGRSQMLEPMNPYERRIIHAVVSEIEGVFSKSKGEDPNRRVIILNENPPARQNNNRNNFKPNQNRNNNNNKPKPTGAKKPVQKYNSGPSIEELLKSDKKTNDDSSINGKLYSKIEL